MNYEGSDFFKIGQKGEGFNTCS